MCIVLEKKQWDAYDALKAMLALMESKEFPSSARVIHSAMCQIQQEPEFHCFVQEYLFAPRGDFPFSSVLQTDLSNMEIAGLLSSPNPEFVRYTVCDKLDRIFEIYVKGRFTQDELETLTRMAQVFEERVTANSCAA